MASFTADPLLFASCIGEQLHYRKQFLNCHSIAIVCEIHLFDCVITLWKKIFVECTHASIDFVCAFEACRPFLSRAVGGVGRASSRAVEHLNIRDIVAQFDYTR